MQGRDIRIHYDHREKLKSVKDVLQENTALGTEGRICIFGSPTKNAMDKTLRSQASIERQLYRAMIKSERLQRQGKGELIPAPISVELSSEK